MAPVIPGRFTAHIDEPFVVFLIGMRINRFLALRKWVPVARAMGPMIRELYQHPEKGFLGAEFFLYWRGPAIVQYWRSFEDLERFARDPDDPHLPAWRRFDRTAGTGGSVGIRHEAYAVEAAHREAIYNNAPAFGLLWPRPPSACRPQGPAGERPSPPPEARGENEPAVPRPLRSSPRAS